MTPHQPGLEEEKHVIRFKSFVKNEFFLSSLLWGEKNMEEFLVLTALPWH